MASNGRKSTRYTYKGNNKKVENKYANIYQDLSEKEEVYKSNVLKKIHKPSDDENEEDDNVRELVTRSLSTEEAEQNAQRRRQAARNQKRIATQKSSPVSSSKRASELSKLESIEKLKREKWALKNNNTEDNINTDIDIQDGSERKRIDLGQSEDVDLGYTKDISENLENADVNDTVVNDAEYIRRKARERASMDKSNVKIYKEYSDFERPNIGEKRENKKEDDKSSISNEEDDDSFDTKILDSSILDMPIVDENTTGYEDDETTKREILKNEQDIKERENEIEKILKLKEEKFGDSSNSTTLDRSSRRRSRSQKNDSDELNTTDKTSRANNRGNVYRNNTAKKESKLNIKKIGGIIIVLLLIIVFAAAGIDKLRSSKTKTTQNNAATTQVKKKEDDKSKTEKKEESIEEKINKLEVIKAKLNADESQRMDYIIENIKSYPENMINLLIANPETIDFVYSYKDKDKYNAKSLEGNISSSYYVDGSVPLYLQWDRRWGYRNYGKEMIGLSGCGPTSLAMVIRHFDKESTVNPYDVAKYSEENGYLSKDNFTSWKLFDTGLKEYGLESRDVVPVEAKMKKALDDGQILIVSVKPGIFTERGHIIVIKGYNKEGDFLINDPNSIVNTNKSWSYDELKNDLRKIWAVSEIGSSSYSSSDDNTSDNSSETDSETNTSSSKSSSGSSSSQKNNDSNDDSTGNSDDPSIIQDIE
ncbi:MAG: C39 family peptidase [Peptostreptococcus sp.]|uniref:C39 family peptidase n=1 Tax=Peptostreptococcus sp. TaxID=1262 RepID=UPI002FCA012A